MTLPELKNFEENIHTLHQIVSLFPPICTLLLEKQPNWLHIAMQAHRDGFSTQLFPKGGKLVLDTKNGVVQYVRADGGIAAMPLLTPDDDLSYTQHSLFEMILDAMTIDELDGFFEDFERGKLAQMLFTKLYADKPEKLAAAIADHSHEESLSYDATAIDTYMQALDMVYTGIARWRAQVNGHLSPVVVWGEHFDLSTLWFKDPAMDDYKPHINIGFAPFTKGIFDRPYFYAYAYPYAENYTVPDLALPLKWETEAYTGIYLAYDDLVAEGATIYDIESYSGQMFEALKSVLA